MRRLLLPLTVLTACALPAAAADATTYCVGKPACAAIAGHATAPNLKAAIDAAAASPGQDAIELGTGTFPYPGAAPLVADTNDISSITGMGQGATHLVEGATAPALEVDDPGAVVQDLTVDTIAGSTSSSALVVRSTGTTARRVTVGGQGNSGTGVALDSGAVLDHVTVDLPQAASGMYAAYVFGDGGGTILDSSFRSTFGIRVNDPARTTLRNVRTDARWRPIQIDQGIVDVDGLLASSPATSVEELVSVATGATANLTLRHATLVRSTGNSGVAVNAYSAASRATVTARDVVVAGPGSGSAFSRTTSGGGVATVSIAYSAYDPSKISNIPALPGPTDLALPADPGFNDDYSLRAGSALIDRGEPVLPAGAAATDLAGGARVFGGRTDIGAYEWAPPVVPASTPAPVGAAGTTTPPPASGPAPAALPAATGRPGAASLLVLSATARQRLDRHGRFAVRATCDAALGCRGTLKLAARSGRRAVTLGTAKLALKRGRSATLRIALTRSGRALLRRRGTLSVAVSASVRDGGGARLPAATAFSGRRR